LGARICERGEILINLRQAVLAFIIALIFSILVFSQSPGGGIPPTFTGLDVVILLDQSGSMWGFSNTPHPAQNDKYEHRIGQTKNILYRLAEHVENTPFVHHVSVIDFGDIAKVAISKHEMRYDPTDPGAALRITKSVADRYITAKNWINTNTPAAMQFGLQEFKDMASLQPANGRKQVMLLITDGRPNLPGKKTDTELQQEIQGYANDLKGKNIGLWVVGLNDASNYWNEGDGAVWERIATPQHAHLAETASSNIFTVMQSIIDEWLETNSQNLTGNEYECPPYIQRIIFNVNFGTPRSSITINDPDGNSIPLSAGGAASNPGTTARFQVEGPKPGVYRISKDPTRSYHVSVEEFSPNIKRLSPAGAVSLDSETKLRFQVTDNNGIPVVILPGSPVKASVVVTSSSPAQTTQEVAASFEGDGKFQAKWKPTQLGVYTIKLKGEITLKNGSSYDVFNASAHSYDDKVTVSRLNPYWLRLNTPDPAGTLRLWPWNKSAKVQFSLVNKDGQPVTSVGSVVSNPSTWLTLQAIDISGAPLPSPATPFTVDASGTFEADVPVDLSFFKGEGWLIAKQVNFQVIAQPNRMTGEDFLDSIQLPPEAEDKRVGGDPMAIGPITTRYAWIVFLSIWLAFILLVLGIFWFLFMRLLPGLVIWRADSSRHRTVELKIYNGADDPNGEFARKYPAGTWDRFKYDREFSQTVDGQEYILQKFRVQRVPSLDQVMVQVKYSWQNAPDKEYTALLSKGRIERLKGLPSGEYLLALEAK
jgi:hypothetical protein